MHGSQTLDSARAARWRRLVALGGIGALGLALAATTTPASSRSHPATPRAAASVGHSESAPADPGKIAAALIKRGVLPRSASPAQIEAAVQTYLQRKVPAAGGGRGGNVLANKRLDANEAALNAAAESSTVRGRKYGVTQTVAPSAPAFQSLDKTGKLLLIAVDFSETPFTWTDAEATENTASGPLHNGIPEPTNTFDNWVPDFTVQHYKDMLFTPGGWTIPAGRPHAGQQRPSMRDYYLEQSYGRYTVNGDAFGWFTVDKPEAYYGDDRSDTGEDNLEPGTTSDLIADAVVKINAANAIPWASYDTNNDCVIDHPLFIHAGVDQSAGGGVQGDDSIWAHSASVDVPVTGATAGCPDGIRIDNYTIMPEDGGVGVFAHEFGHDLGLPDEYDTIYSGRGESVAYWSLMSGGSWMGQPAESQPANISPYGKYALGWLKPGENLATIDSSQLGKTPQSVRLEQVERWGGAGTNNAVRVNLPDKPYYVNTPHSGTNEWFGGKADELDTTLARSVDLTGKTSASLSFWTWYDIEENWDYGFVQVSTDGGTTWTSLPIAGTSSSIDSSGMPEIAAQLPGFTGNSGGWVQKTADLSAYAGKNIQLQFRYMTDWGTTFAGFYVDDISMTANGSPVFSDDVETLDSAWAVDGWTREPGNGTKPHYYLLELRNLNHFTTPYGGTNLVNSDAALSTAYSFDAYGSTGNPDEPWWFPYQPGLLLWYRDATFTDNWIGVHPGRGFLLVVDAHNSPMLRPPTQQSGSLPWFSRVASYDAPFGLSPVSPITVGYWGRVRTYAGEVGVPTFDDGLSWWSAKAPNASVIVPQYGLTFRVMGQATDGSAAMVGFAKK